MRIINEAELAGLEFKARKDSVLDTDKYADLKALRVGQGLVIDLNGISKGEYKTIAKSSSPYSWARKRGWMIRRRLTNDNKLVIIRIK